MKKISFLIAITLFVCSLNGQKAEVALREYFADAEFFLLQEYYEDALHDYREVYKRGYQENANVNYRIGICYLNIPGQKDKAIDYLLIAAQSASSKYTESTLRETRAPIDAFLYLGNAYRVNNQLDKAISAYNQYKELLGDNDELLFQYAQKQIETCNIANQFLSAPELVEFVNLGEQINNNNANYKAVLSGDGNSIVFMTRLPFYDAVYFSKMVDGTWERPKNITPDIMSDGNQFVSDISYDGTILLLTKEDEFNSDIYISYQQEGKWNKSVPISKKINTRFWESHASLSKDGKEIYFTSNKKGGLGEMDIYKSVLDEDGEWDDPVNLGDVINSVFNEDAPFISEDGTKLYFSSQGHLNMGGYDIFVSELNDTSWGLPQNLRSPINTTDDDVFFFPWNNGEVAYMSRIDIDGQGHYDVYRVEFPKQELVDESIAAAIQADIDEELEIQKTAIDSVVEKEEVPIAAVEEKATVDVPVPVVVPSVVELEISPIFFEFDRYRITPEARKELDKLLEILKSNNTLILKITAHTDALGPAEYNLRLSELRAKSVQKYFTDKGLKVSQIKTIGMGEKEFIAINTNKDGSDNPEGRKYNRRAELMVTGLDKTKIIIKRIDPVPERLRQNN